MKILVDADACPVKEEVYRVARRHGLSVLLVANSAMAVPPGGSVRLERVGGGRLDAADDRIVEHALPGDLVVTDDILLAARCLGQGARVLSPKGRRFSEDNIGDALATREVLSQLREGGAPTGGPAPFEKRDRSRFLERLEAALREPRA
jgi:uncharacterized protein YaiI (UPF0178 family)